MRTLLKFVSALALALTVAPAILFFRGSLDLVQVKTAMLVAAVVWFLATPFWMGQSTAIEHEEVVL